MTSNKLLDFRFHSKNGVLSREYQAQNNSEIKQSVCKFLEFIERDDLFDAEKATQSLIESGEYQDGSLILVAKSN